MTDEIYYRSFLNRDRLVHILDADPGTCEALSVLFRLEGFLTTFSLDLTNFLAGLERRRPDVVIVNRLLGEEDGVGVVTHVKGLHAGIPVFVLSDDPDVYAAVRAMKAGASDVITKPVDTEYFVRAVHDALRQDVYLGAAHGGWRPVEIRGFGQLTPRERQVLQEITNGQSNKEAGKALGISPRTVEVHRARIMEKLGARNTADLMRIVLTT